jgi:type I restriction enzyme M protein
MDIDTKRRIDTARDILVGKLPDPKSQIEQITIALIYKFMDDIDKQSEELGGKVKFFSGEFEKYSWSKIFDPRVSGFELVNLYSEAIQRMDNNPNIPPLFREIFKNANLPYRDPETLKMFLKVIGEFEYDHSERLGDAYEHLLSIMGSQGEAGQFRTPRHIIDFMVEVTDPQKNETILDPACGTAGFLIFSYKHILNKNRIDNYVNLSSEERGRLVQNIVGYDISPDMVRIALVNMYLHGLQNPKIYEYDTLTYEDKWNEYYDIILANPPFMSPRGGIRPHKRFSIQSKRSEVLFVDYIAEHLTPNGRGAVIVPEGIIFQSGNAYKKLRKSLIENSLYAVVSLPAGVFNPYSGVKTSILFLNKDLVKRTDSILFVKINHDGFDLGAQRRKIIENDLPLALEIMKKYQQSINENMELKLDTNEAKLAHIVKKEKIAESGDYNLSGDRYKETVVYSGKWDFVELGKVCKLMIDGDWIESKDQSSKGIRLIQTGNIGIGCFLNKKEKGKFISEETFSRLKCKEVFEGDILISRLPEPVGRACLVPNLSIRMITAVDCTIVRTKQNILIPKFLLFLTISNQYFKLIEGYLTGSSRKRISRKNLEKIKIPLPPLEIQEQIVAELENYQKIIDGARQVVENYKPTFKINPDWEMVELGYTCKFVRGPFGAALKKDIFVEKGFKIYEQKHAINNDFSIGEYYIRPKISRNE